jgi:hypothetical protein
MCVDCINTAAHAVSSLPAWLQLGVFYAQQGWGAVYPLLRRYL